MGQGALFEITTPVQKALVAMNALMRVSTWLQNKPKWQRRATQPNQAQPTPIGRKAWNVIKELWPKGDFQVPSIATPKQLE